MKTVVTALILNPSKDKFLIVKRKKSDSIHSLLWSFPGGKVKENESIIDALIREVKEETNLETNKDFKKLSEFSYARPNKGITVGICFSCVALSEDVKISKEHDGFKWVNPEDFSNYNHIPGLENEVKNVFSG
ncbi:NUDIX domain-containing protein [Candidatus Woesearchaeota archaeon]|nr:NUDIX domain-containing protein [Candidatus Woesearchaeota archaeon]